ncbi:MAG: ribbon-helix-helix domain-containing protein [Rhodospirillales bacterium]|nr:ribbon-helix-helix domain-containing protein [Rhodospirillales bacterium]
MKKRSIKIAGHATSITLEDEFWEALKDIAARRDMSMNALIAEIDETRATENLSSALRLYVLAQARAGML